MIAHGAKHPGSQVSKGHVVGKAASVDLSGVVTVRIAAIDEHAGSPEASHIRERHGLVVKQQVWDCPGHARIEARSKRPRTNFSPVVFRGTPPQTPKVSLAVAAEVRFCRIRGRERRP
jgi:hypothetical protein